MPAFETNVFTVADLFSSRFVFVFPDLQRPYRWTGAHVNQMVDDLLAASGLRGDGVAGDATYFLGGIVLVTQGKRQKSVIDGRQRLTTLAMILSVLRDLEDDAGNKADLHRCLADEAASALGVLKGYRIVPHDTDAAAFNAWVFERGATLRTISEEDDLPARVYDAVKVVQALRKRLNTLKFPERRKLAEYVLQKCELVAVTAPDDAQGRRIFTVLNTRGLDLSEADSIKPELLALLDPADRQTAFNSWDDFDARLGDKGMDELLRSLMFVYDGRAFAEQYRNIFLRMAGTVGVNRVAIDDVPTYGQALWRLRSRKLDFDSKDKNPNLIIQGLDWIAWDSRDWVPVAAHMIAKTPTDKNRRYALLKGLDRYCYVALTLNYHIDDRRKVFEQIIREINNSIDPLADGNSLSIFRNTVERVRTRLTEPFENWRQRPALIRRIDLALSASDPHLEIDNSTVEHVLPRRPGRGSVWLRTFNARERDELTDTIGNFVLLGYGLNGQIANAPFPAKKKEMFQIDSRPYRLTADLDKNTDWTAETIRKRTKVLAEILMKDLGMA